MLRHFLAWCSRNYFHIFFLLLLFLAAAFKAVSAVALKGQTWKRSSQAYRMAALDNTDIDVCMSFFEKSSVKNNK